MLALSRGRVFWTSMAWVLVLLTVDVLSKLWAYQQGIAVFTRQPTVLAWLPALPSWLLFFIGLGLCYLGLDAIISCINRRQKPKADILFAAGLFGNGLNLLVFGHVVDFIPIPLCGNLGLIANVADGYIVMGFCWLCFSEISENCKKLIKSLEN